MSRWKFAYDIVLIGFCALFEVFAFKNLSRYFLVQALFIVLYFKRLTFLVYRPIGAFFSIAELHETLAYFPAQSLQAAVPWALLAFAPCDRRIQPGIPPDVSHRRALVHVDMSY